MKKLTILHSNDIHGDFLSEIQTGKGNLIGGLALLSGYINQVRKEEENVLFVVSGDMVQGSLIDSEYKGISTMEIMNYLSPDVVGLGNHEFDYGLPHLLFLEKMANFPIVNANLYIKKYHKRLMNPYHIIKKAGLDILFTGIITEKILDALKADSLIGSFVNLEEASHEVGKICNAYRNDDIDLTILLTHIGYESDIEFAKLLKPQWGVDIIIGGHSHTVLKKPEKVNNILIATAGTGSDQIGRFDIVLDEDTNKIVEYTWKLIPINNETAKPDIALEEYIYSFKNKIDTKYSVVLGKFARVLTHSKREIETSLGNLVADAFALIGSSDVALVGSGSIRQNSLGPIVTLKDFLQCFPYDDSLHRFEVTGKQIRSMFSFWMRPENRTGEGECYQVNSDIVAVYDERAKSLQSLFVNHKPVKDSAVYTLILQGYHYMNALSYLNISESELFHAGKHTIVTTSVQDVLEEYFKSNQNISAQVEGRLLYK